MESPLFQPYMGHSFLQKMVSLQGCTTKPKSSATKQKFFKWLRTKPSGVPYIFSILGIKEKFCTKGQKAQTEYTETDTVIHHQENKTKKLF